MPDLNEQDYLQAIICENNEKAFLPLVEDVSEWLKNFMNIDITTENFLPTLDNGVYLCVLAEKLQFCFQRSCEISTGQINQTKFLKCLPKLDFKYHKVASSGSFFARENAENFIKWCRQLGIKDSTLFVSEGLVLHKQLKNVVLTLLELGRIASKYHLTTIPSLIKLENDIEEEIFQNSRSNVTIRRKKVKKDIINCLDDKVKSSAKKHNVNLEKVANGKYVVNQKSAMFVRVLREHIMVRVGGGWDELDHFLDRQNPKKLSKFLVSSSVNAL